MVIKGVIFDFGFTLFYFDNPSVEKYYECFKKGLLKSIWVLKEKQVWNETLTNEAFINKFSKQRQYFFRKSIKTKNEFPTSMIFQDVLESLEKEEIIKNLDLLTDIAYEELAELYHSCEEEQWEPFENTKETLAELTIRNLKIALISNHPNHKTIKNVLKKHDLLKYFNYITTSAKFGKRKPDPSIFFHTVKKIGLEKFPNSVLVCGDEYADIIGAQRANLQSILLERKYKFPFEKEIDVLNLRKISNISEILKYIE
ncbi:MAG: HAD family hydrolase [Promethearchaeota archaeon]